MKKVSRNARKRILNIIFLLALIAVTMAVLIASNSELNFENIGEFIRESNPWLLTAAFLCMIAGIICEGLSLHLISRKLGHKSRLVSSMAYSTADIYYSAITPSASGGQPASAFYMVKDGMSVGTATFTLVFNVIAYSAAFLVMAATAFIIAPTTFIAFNPLVQFLIILGIVLQLFLLSFFIACMFCHRAVLKIGNWFISLLAKIKIVKKPDKWRAKLSEEVEKYGACINIIKKHRTTFFGALLLNVCQRFVRVLISCFVCLAADPEAPFLTIFALQSFLIVGYTNIPLPGGVGVFEYLYLHIYDAIYSSAAFILSAMMVTRAISYYLSIVVSGVVTLSYHINLMKKKTTEPAALVENTGENTQSDSLDEVTESGEETADSAVTEEELIADGE